MSVLRRPDDHHRNLRRRSPCATATAGPDQDRHLMIIAALSPSQRRFSSPPAARRSSKAMSPQGRQSFSKRSAHTRRSHARPRKRSSSWFPPTESDPPDPEPPTALHPRPSNPHRSPRSTSPLPPRGFLLGRLSNAGPAPRPTVLQRACAVKGGAFQWVRAPPGETLQPEATGAVMEVTKWLKPSV